MSLAMTRTERVAFLMDVHVGIISIVQKDAPPLTVPIWYDYAPDKGLWVITGSGSQKGKALAAAGAFSLCAQVETPPAYKYVSVEGRITETRPADVEADVRPMARRYFGEQLGDQYVASTPDDHGLVFTMTPERWRTVDYAKLGG